MKASCIDRWWVDLALPGTKRRGGGMWEAIPFWRPSLSGKSLEKRKSNLKISPRGIVDFGTGRTYTPLDTVMCARRCDIRDAAAWLEKRVGAEGLFSTFSGAKLVGEQNVPHETKEGHSENGLSQKALLINKQDQSARPAAKEEKTEKINWLSAPSFENKPKKYGKASAVLSSEEEFWKLLPRETPPFPIIDVERNCPGLLGKIAVYLEEAGTVITEAGGLAIALPLLGAIMGRPYETPTGLRTNIYSVALGESGIGKTALVESAKALL